MKFFENSFVKFLVLAVAVDLAGRAEGNPYCLQQTETEIVTITLFGCFQSVNYMKDLEQAPTDTFAVTFSNSDIPVLKNGSFARFTDDLTFVGLHSVGLKDIESDAFQGATGLMILALMDNKLEVIKGEWFRNLLTLDTVSFQNNHIHTVEGNFFTTVISLGELDFYGNQLTDLPRTEFEHFKVHKFGFKNNPWSEESSTWLAATMKEKNITEHDTVAEHNIIGDPTGLRTDSYTEVALPADPGAVDGRETNDALTDVEIHNKEDFCKFIVDHPSPFYICDTRSEQS